MTAARIVASVSVTMALLAPAGVAAQEPVADAPADDAVVVAVIDNAFSPYHWDFSGSMMPQHTDADPANDLPLDQPPDTWLPGFPTRDSFASFRELPITLDEENPGRATSNLQSMDAGVWDSVRQSDASAAHYNWIPGTKFVGALDFAGNKIRSSNGAHGANTSAVSVGNFHGTCPECLLVAITYSGAASGEAAIDWAMSQPWIDAITNSYGFSLLVRDRLYSGSNIELQREASERGQHVFFSAGNGQANAFAVPNTTLLSSQEGPDWITTVGAITPAGGNYTGAGKPADIASLGSGYPSLGGSSVSGTGSFSGTSNATPVVAGMYARALLWARERLDGASRTQADGVVAAGAPVACGDQRPDCELADGILTATELRTRLYHAAIPTPQGPHPSLSPIGSPVTAAEYDLLAEGHGSFFARLTDDGRWEEEQDRITGPMDGTAELTPRPAGEQEWMIVDSYCRQSIWEQWSGGYYRDGETALPGPDPLWPTRTALASSCDQLFPPF